MLHAAHCDVLAVRLTCDAAMTTDTQRPRIRVDVETSYIEEQSDPRDKRFVFSYTITIRNEGQVPARLLTRHWIITDANGNVKETRGDGVVGEQPYLKPGQGFRYSSGAVIETPVGTMQGSYQMMADDGLKFDAPIAPFRLGHSRSLALSRWRTYAIGDIQGCDAELGALLQTLNFSARPRPVWFVGDLVNRGPASLEVLRRVRALGDAATVTLGNHDLHLLAVALGCSRLRIRRHSGADLGGAGPRRAARMAAATARCSPRITPRICVWCTADSPRSGTCRLRAACARELEQALRSQPEKLFKHMYGDKPDRWDPALEGVERLRYIVNCFTRLRYVDEHGRLELHAKGAPGKAKTASLIPWFEAPGARWRGTRVVFGHWSTLGFFQNADVIGLDTGCVWGGSLTALRLDVPSAAPVQVGCRAL